MSRENQFFDIGVQGRKTGIQVPTQERDAFGLENPEGFFTPSPAPEKVSRPLNAFLSGTQGGGVNASPAPAMAAAALKAVAQVVGDVTSGEESMDLDSGVDNYDRRPPSAISTHHNLPPPSSIPQPIRARSPFKPAVTNSVNPITSTPPRRPRSVGPTTPGFTPVNTALSTANNLNRVLNFNTSNEGVGRGLQSPIIKGQPPRRPNAPHPPAAGSGMQAKVTRRKDLFSSPMAPMMGRARSPSIDTGSDNRSIFGNGPGKVDGGRARTPGIDTGSDSRSIFGNGSGKADGNAGTTTTTTTAPPPPPVKGQDKREPQDKTTDAVLTTMETTYTESTTAPKPTTVAPAKLALAPPKTTTTSQTAPLPTAVKPALTKKKLLSSRPSMMAGSAQPAFTLSDDEEDIPTSKATKAPLQAQEEEEEEEDAEEIGVSGKKWKIKAKPQAKVVEKPRGKKKLSDVIEEAESVEAEEEEEEAEEAVEEAAPQARVKGKKAAAATVPSSAAVMGKAKSQQAKHAPEPVVSAAKSNAVKGRGGKAAHFEEEEEEEDVDGDVQEEEEVEFESPIPKKKLSKKAAAQEAREVEAKAAAAPKKEKEGKKGKKQPAPEPQPEPEEEEEEEEEQEEEEEEEEEEVIAPPKRARGGKAGSATTAAAAVAHSSSSLPAAKGKPGRGRPKMVQDPAPEPEPEQQEDAEPEPQLVAKGGRGRKKAAQAEAQKGLEEEEAKLSRPPPPAKKEKGKPGRKKKVVEEEVVVEPEREQVGDEMVEQDEPVVKGKGRGRGKGKGKAIAEPEIDEPAAAITKKPISKPAKPKGKGKGKVPASAAPESDTEMLDADGDPAASQFTHEATAPTTNEYYSDDADPSIGSAPKRPRKYTKRPARTTHSRSATPDPLSHPAVTQTQKISIAPLLAPLPDPSDANKRRSCRARITPLAFWNGEKVLTHIEEAGDGAGGKVQVRKEVVRVEEVVPPKQKRSRTRGRSASASAAPLDSKPTKKRKRGAAAVSRIAEEDGGEDGGEGYDSSDSDASLEHWESTTGSFTGLIKSRDGTGALVSSVLAYAPHSMTTNPVAGSTFRMNKTVSYDHLGTGIIEIPPGGQKRWKPSGRYDLVFYVVGGKVWVAVGDNGFVVRKGGQFQVGRGNLYSIENQFDRPAKLFFVQGCETPAAMQK